MYLLCYGRRVFQPQQHITISLKQTIFTRNLHNKNLLRFPIKSWLSPPRKKLTTLALNIFPRRTFNYKYLGLVFVVPVARNLLFQTANCEKFKLSHRNRISPSKQVLQKREPRFNWRLFWELIEPDVILFILAAISALAVALVNIKLPILLGELINSITIIVRDDTNNNNIYNTLYEPCKKLIFNYALQSILTCTYITLLSCFGERLATRMRVKLFKSLMEQDMSFFDGHKTGEVINRLTTDIQDFKSSFKQIISQGLRSTTQIIGCGLTLFSLSPKLTSLMVLILPGIILIGSGLGTLLRQVSRRAQEQISVAMSVADEAIGNIRTVRAFAMEHKEIGWYTSEIQKAQFYNEVLGAGVGAFQGLTNFAINGIVLVVLYTGAMLIDSNELRAGDLMSYLVATQTVQRSLGSISILFGQVVRGMSAGARTFEYMELRPSLKLCGGKKLAKDKIIGNITLEDVRFSYPTRPDHVVMDKLSLNVEAGKVMALCGASGSGKSTIAALIEGFYNVDGGSIKVDGVDVRDLDPSWMRGDLIGYINQEPTLFATTVLENIRYGSPQATDKQVIEAAKQANADQFIRGFPQGYDTMVGERGATVSGGQKQRIAIARALLKNPKILILDEATSALDAESERIVQTALDKLIQGRTVLVIAHRLSTIQNADKIAVMSHGSIQEIGTHDELLKRNGLYADLIKRQTTDDIIP